MDYCEYAMGDSRPPARSTTQTMHRRATTAATPSGAIDYELIEPPDDANAPAVVFLNGLGNHRTMWARQRERFKRTHALLFIDNRGIGDSDAPPGFWSVADHANDVLHVMAKVVPQWSVAVSARPIHVVGHSMGGFIAYEVTRRAAEFRIASLTLVSCSLFTSCLSLRPTGLLGVGSMLFAADPRSLLETSMELNYPSAWRVQRAFDGRGGTNEDAATRFLVANLSGRRIIKPMTWFKQVFAYFTYAAPPVDRDKPFVRSLVIGGDEDSLVRASSLEASAAKLGAECVVLTGGGHNIFVQMAEEVNSALERHWAGVVRAPPSPGSVHAGEADALL